MYNSRNIDDLRADVAANCRVFLARCKAEGLPVLVTGTVRDAEYQMECFRRGTSKAKKAAFHAQGIGLAFDFCKNVKGHEYDDDGFWVRCGEIGERVGFEWGGRWTSFPDRPHLQWSGPKHNYKSADIWAGRLPPQMPPCKEEIELTKDEIVKLIREEVIRELAERDDVAAKAAQKVSPWATHWPSATEAGVVDGTRPGAGASREQVIEIVGRLGLIPEVK